MQTLISVLGTILFFLKIVLGLSLIVLGAMLVTYIHDEIKEVRAERSIELAKIKADNDTLFGEWVGAMHRRVKPAEPSTGRHRVVKGAPSYSKSFEFNAPRTPIFNDENFFAALLREKEEIAPIF